jgi:hypothetical protein
MAGAAHRHLLPVITHAGRVMARPDLSQKERIMEFGDLFHWLWTLALTGWVVLRDRIFARRIARQGDDLSGMFKVLGRMQRRARMDAQKAG